MGLDMYLMKNLFLSHDQPPFQEVAAATGLPKDARYIEVVATVCYWRQAGTVHNWFVKNVQGGADDCNSYGVSVATLKTLVEAAREALQDYDAWAKIPSEYRPEAPSLSKKVFPPVYEFDSDYREELAETITKVEKVIEEHDDKENFYYTYRSSW